MSVKERKKLIDSWQQWRAASTAILNEYLRTGKTVKLLREPPKQMIVSGQVRETTCKKAMTVVVFLKTMHKRDEDKAHFQFGEKPPA